MRGHHAGVHHVNHRAAAEGVAAILAVEEAGALIDPIEMPEKIRGHRIAATGEGGRIVRGIEGDLRLAATGRSELLRPGRHRIDGERKQNCGEGSSQRGHLNFSDVLDDAK